MYGKPKFRVPGQGQLQTSSHAIDQELTNGESVLLASLSVSFLLLYPIVLQHKGSACPSSCGWAGSWLGQ